MSLIGCSQTAAAQLWPPFHAVSAHAFGRSCRCALFYLLICRIFFCVCLRRCPCPFCCFGDAICACVLSLFELCQSLQSRSLMCNHQTHAHASTSTTPSVSSAVPCRPLLPQSLTHKPGKDDEGWMLTETKQGRCQKVHRSQGEQAQIYLIQKCGVLWDTVESGSAGHGMIRDVLS
jgi:hypothetical protein